MLSKKQIDLLAWTKQKWRTKSGKKSSITGERYLPEKAIKFCRHLNINKLQKLNEKLQKKANNFQINQSI